jgi:hypothetical protein
MANSIPSTDTPSLLARLDGVAAYTLVLAARRQLSPAVLELVCEGNLSGFTAHAGNDLMLAVPIEGGDGSFRRRYTIRRVLKERNQIEFWIDTTADGPGSRWAKDIPIGSSIEVIGPRGKVTLDELADWHLFIGDLSFLSAAYAMAETIEPPGQALFIFEIDNPEDIVLPTLDDRIGVTFCVVERGGRTFDDAAGLQASLDALDFPADLGHVYVGGELSVVGSLQAALLKRGLAKEQINAKPYWRLGVANMAHGEPKKN